MKNYKAYQIISVLSEEELELFESFLKSPYHNTRAKPVELFKIIRKNILKKNTELSKEKLFEMLYPGKRFNSNTFNDLMSQLHRLSEDFLYAEINKKDKIKKEVALLDKFLARRFKGLFLAKRKQLDKLMDENEAVDSFFYWNSYLKEGTYCNYLFTYTNAKTKKDFEIISTSLHKAYLNLLNLFLDDSLAFYFQVETRKQDHIDYNFLELVTNIIKKNYDEKIISLAKHNNKYYYHIEILKRLLDMALHEDVDRYYFDYKKTLKKFRQKISFDQFVLFYASVIHYCHKRVRENPGNTTFVKENKTIFKETISKKYYSSLKVNLFRPKLYSVFLNSFFITRDIANIKKMIGVCIPLVEKNYVNFFNNLSLSYICFIQKDYIKALEYVSTIQPNFKLNEKSFKIYLIKLNLHLNNTELVLSLIEAFSKFYKNHFKEENYIGTMNFLKFLKNITLFNEKKKTQDLNYLRQKISESKTIEKGWLLEILDEILKNKNPAALSR